MRGDHLTLRAPLASERLNARRGAALITPFATLGCPIFHCHPYLPKGANGAGGAVVNLRPPAQEGSIELARPPARIRPHSSTHRAPVFPLSKAELPSGQCVVTGEDDPWATFPRRLITH
jgi:hypothetical protein